MTVVAGKNKRITFVECNNDLNAMIDIAKVVDLVLLMIDGSYGFEMVRFSFETVVAYRSYRSRIRNLSSS